MKYQRPYLGLFVGGASVRMGGHPKGLLKAPDTNEPIVVRTVRIARELQIPTVFTGISPAYQTVLPHVPTVTDAPFGIGPLGGLRALMLHAYPLPVIALACDMPLIQKNTLELLCTTQSDADIDMVSHSPTELQPFFAKYQTTLVLPLLERVIHLRKSYALRQLFTATAHYQPTVNWLCATQNDVLDWDQPSDLHDSL